jgi:hypothetical protein
MGPQAGAVEVRGRRKIPSGGGYVAVRAMNYELETASM